MPGIKYWDGSAWVTIPLGVPVYEQPGDPGAVPIGSIWIDTDAVAPQVLPVSLVSSLPGSPVDGQEIYYQSAAMATDGIEWHLRYRAGSPSAYKWEFIGGNPIRDAKTAQGSSPATTAYTDLTDGAGPTVTAPLPGVYDIEFGAGFLFNGTTAGGVFMGVSIAGAAATDADAAQASLGANQAAPASNLLLSRTLLATQTVVAKYRAPSQFVAASNRWVRIRPLRVG